MLEPRLYRVGLIPVLFAVLIVAFAFREAPRSIGTTLAADAFSGTRAAVDLDRLGDAYPVRRPGSVADGELAKRVADTLRANRFSVETRTHRGQTIDGARDLDLVIGERPGISPGRLVVVAHRDAAGVGARAELSGTAALLELARVFGAPRRTTQTLTLVSTSGGSGGAAGARELARQLSGDDVAAILVLGAMATQPLRRPLVVGWSDGVGSAPLRLRRTVERAFRNEAGIDAGSSRALQQLLRNVVPGTLGEQGPLVDAGLPAVLISTSGEAPPPADAIVSAAQLQGVGRSVLRAITALDNASTPVGAVRADVVVSGLVLPGWAPRLLVGVLLLGPLIVLIDAFARLRRNGARLVPWFGWVMVAAIAPFGTFAFIRLLGLTGLLPVAPGSPTPIAFVPVQAWALIGAIVVGLVVWGGLRPVRRRLRTAGADDMTTPGAALATLTVLWVVVAVTWVGNPYAAGMLIVLLHVWLFVLTPEFRPPRAFGVAVTLIAVAPLVAVCGWVAATYGLGSGELGWAALLAVAGGHASVLTWTCGAALAGAILVGGQIVARGGQQNGDAEAQITVRGPVSYAGPGSLGGVPSAARQ